MYQGPGCSVQEHIDRLRRERISYRLVGVSLSFPFPRRIAESEEAEEEDHLEGAITININNSSATFFDVINNSLFLFSGFMPRNPGYSSVCSDVRALRHSIVAGVLAASCLAAQLIFRHLQLAPSMDRQ